MTALMTGRNAMEIMWNGDKVIRRVLQVMIIGAIKWTLLTAVFIGQDKTHWGGVRWKVLHTFDADGKIF
jgi:hypothetical protein